MRFLCLHGIGTDSQIFKMQTAALRFELADHHSYEFVQGVVPWPLAPGLGFLSNPNPSTKHYYAYYDIGDGTVSNASGLIKALEQLEAYLASEGPFDGVLAFSQGAGLAAMFLIRDHLQHPDALPPFKFGVFFSPISVYDPVAYSERGEMKIMERSKDGKCAIDLPLAVIYGKADDRQQESRGFLEVCNPEKLSVLVHKGGHEVPGIGVRDEIDNVVKVVKRCIYAADLLA